MLQYITDIKDIQHGIEWRVTTGIQGLSLGGGILNHLPEDRYFPWQRIH